MLAAVAVIGVVGYFGAARLADRIGPGESMLWLVAGTGLLTWGACGLTFRALGYSLTALAPADGERTPPSRPWLKEKP